MSLSLSLSKYPILNPVVHRPLRLPSFSAKLLTKFIILVAIFLRPANLNTFHSGICLYYSTEFTISISDGYFGSSSYLLYQQYLALWTTPSPLKNSI